LLSNWLLSILELTTMVVVIMTLREGFLHSAPLRISLLWSFKAARLFIRIGKLHLLSNWRLFVFWPHQWLLLSWHRRNRHCCYVKAKSLREGFLHSALASMIFCSAYSPDTDW
jgi:hypothetical protein